jgi:hypothetical protein
MADIKRTQHLWKGLVEKTGAYLGLRGLRDLVVEDRPGCVAATSFQQDVFETQLEQFRHAPRQDDLASNLVPVAVLALQHEHFVAFLGQHRGERGTRDPAAHDSDVCRVGHRCGG